MRKLLFLCVVTCFTLLAHAEQLTTDAIYVEDASQKQCYRLTNRPSIQYDETNIYVFVHGQSVLSLSRQSGAKVTYGTYQETTGIEEIFVINPADNGNKDGKYLYQGQIIIVKDNQYYNIQGQKIQ